ncbi:glycoside hydrolase family 127 protein [Actinoplanes sp. URMC 104]|uniref:glycoside hydrolase family 127 protein n=1 Tax=Actinoplanes sp. URMC 104 TaxID=3423409 RepID=UPI003F192C5D
MSGPLLPTAGALGRLRPVPSGSARITGGFWAARQQANRESAIASGPERLEKAGNLDNLRIAAGEREGGTRGLIFMDSDVYKWLEAAAWEYARRPSDELLRAQREITAVVAAAQEPDGYLSSVVKAEGKGRYHNLPWSHEHYCAGHLFQAAVAQVRSTGDRALLDVATRFADHLVATFGEDKRHDVDGHPEVETALVELFRETGNRSYLELARYFVDARGHGLMAGYGEEPTYFSDRVPVREQTTVEGHAVRAVYLGAGAADVAVELQDEELLDALTRQFADMLATKTYLTGGLGSRWDRESFGDPYELPPDRAYAETCAAVGGVHWAWRMLLATGDALYADVAERMLHNGFAAGVSLSGGEYFYVNPLQLRSGAHADENRSPAHGRRGWFDCACCPPNVMRTLASLDSYLATTDDDGVQLHLYAPSEISADGRRLSVETEYPWDGRIRVRVDETPDGEWTLALRVPGWARGATLTVAGEQQPAGPGAYATVRRTWQAGDVAELVLPMDVRVVAADERIDAVRDCVAFERGPLVYALEQVDQPDGVTVDDVRADPEGELTAEHRPYLLGGVTVVTVPGWARRHEPEPWPYGAAAAGSGGAVRLTAIPYFAWANRDIGPMRVWLPR